MDKSAQVGGSLEGQGGAGDTTRSVGFQVVMVMTMASSVIPSATISVLAAPIIEEFGLTRTQLGGLLAVFTGAGALWSLLVGRVVDFLGRTRRVLVVLLVMSILTTLWIAAAPTYLWVVGCLFMAAVITGGANPVTNKLIAVATPARQQGTTVGLKQSGVQLSYFVAGVTVPPVAIAWGWRSAVAATALVPLAGLLLTLRCVPDRYLSRESFKDAASGRHAGGAIWLSIYSLFMGMGVSSVVGYLPLYAHEVIGFSVWSAGLLMSVTGLLGVVARVLLGRLCVRVIHFARLLGVIAVVALVGVTLIWSASLLAEYVLVFGAAMVGVSLMAWNTVAMLAVIRNAGETKTGRTSGAVVLGFMVGLAVAPTLFGLSIDALASYKLGWGMVAATLFLAAIVMVAWDVCSSDQPAAGRQRGG